MPNANNGNISKINSTNQSKTFLIMSLKNYGVLKGTIIEKLDSIEAINRNPSGKPHYQIKVDAGGTIFRIAVNVKSDQNPPNLQVFRSEQYEHPILEQLENFNIGYTHLSSTSESGALDFIRGNLFDMSQMIILPASASSSGDDLNDIFDVFVNQAIKTEGALVYAFGSRWSDDKPDAYFDFEPGNGMHDIHMNQGNNGAHAQDNGVYQDGAIFIYYPDERRWVAMFLKFQSQHVHTDDVTAEPIFTETVFPEIDTPVVVSAALVNPKNVDTGKEEIYLLNTSDVSINLDGWAIVDKNNLKEIISNIHLAAGEVLRYKLSGQHVKLSNKGGTITLINKEGLKVSGVSYTKMEASKQGKVLQF
jgi:uncharacterized protein YukJ